MKAIQLQRHGDSHKAFNIIETEKPSPNAGEVLIKVASSGLNFADVLARRGLYADAPPMPSILGYDVSGVIEEVGEGVEDLEKGQRVTALSRFGGYAEYVSTMREGVAVIPDDMDFNEATAYATQGCTAYFCAEECTSLHAGDKVVVHAAAGGVGSLLVQIAKHHGCFIYGTASSSKIEYLKNLGVDHPIDYTKSEFHAIIKENHPEGIDVIFDSLGGKTFRRGMSVLGPGGRMISFGAASQISGTDTSKIKALGVALNFGLYSPIPLLMQSKSIITVNMLRIADHRPHVFKHVLDEVVRMAGKKILKAQVSKVFPASEIGNAHDFLESRSSIGKVAISWQ